VSNNQHSCQLHNVSLLADQLTRGGIVLQRIKKLRRSSKRRLAYLLNVLRERITPKAATRSVQPENILQPGDVVLVRSRREIQATLDRWNTINYCGFMEEMWGYCGTRQKVLKRVERFLDERDYLVKKTRGIVILENVQCEGTVDFGKCDRTCFFFWRDEWLIKVRTNTG
jgi:hypothetical protein